MTKRMPKVPAEQRSKKGPGSDPKIQRDEELPERDNRESRQANIEQNTTHQGYQQDR